MTDWKLVFITNEGDYGVAWDIICSYTEESSSDNCYQDGDKIWIRFVDDTLEDVKGALKDITQLFTNELIPFHYKILKSNIVWKEVKP